MDWIVMYYFKTFHKTKICVILYYSWAAETYKLKHFHTCELLNIWIRSGTAGPVGLLLLAAVVMAGRSCSFTFSWPICHRASGFGAVLWFKVAHNCALWCWTCPTWFDSLGEFVVAWDTLHSGPMFTLLLSIQGSYKQHPKQIQNETALDPKTT